MQSGSPNCSRSLSLEEEEENSFEKESFSPHGVLKIPQSVLLVVKILLN